MKSDMKAMRNSGVWNNKIGYIFLEVIAEILKFATIVYTSLEQLPIITFAIENVYKKDSCQHGNILFHAYIIAVVALIIFA